MTRQQPAKTPDQYIGARVEIAAETVAGASLISSSACTSSAKRNGVKRRFRRSRKVRPSGFRWLTCWRSQPRWVCSQHCWSRR